MANPAPDFTYSVAVLAFPLETSDGQRVALTMDGLAEDLQERGLYHNYLVDSTGNMVADIDQS